MTTKFNIGESVCLYDFDDEKVVFGTIWAYKHTHLNNIVPTLVKL